MRIFTLFFVSMLAIITLAGSTSLAAPYDPGAKEVCDKASGSAFCGKQSTSGNPITGSDGIIPQVISIIAFFAGSVAVIMIIIGGIKFALSNGDSAKAAGGRQTILYGVIGLVVVVAAQAIISFAINQLT